RRTVFEKGPGGCQYVVSKPVNRLPVETFACRGTFGISLREHDVGITVRRVELTGLARIVGRYGSVLETEFGTRNLHGNHRLGQRIGLLVERSLQESDRLGVVSRLDESRSH